VAAEEGRARLFFVAAGWARCDPEVAASASASASAAFASAACNTIQLGFQSKKH
jgi:hypothetical protein